MIPNDPITPRFVARRVKLAREDRFMTQSRLAEISGLTQAQISRLEQGSVSSINVNDIILLSKALSLSLTEFLDTDIVAFQKTLQQSRPALPEDNRLQNWSCGNTELETELQTWLQAGKTVSFQNIEDGMECFLAADALKEALVIAYSKEEVVGNLNPSQRLDIYSNENDYAKYREYPVFSFMNIADLFAVPTQAMVCLSPQKDWELFSEYWQQTCEKGWLHIKRNTNNQLMVFQIAYTKQGSHLAEIPVWTQVSKQIWERQNPLLDQEVAANYSAPASSIIENPFLPPEGVVPFGQNEKGQPLGVPLEAFSRHTYICGATGSGKSTMLEWLVYGLAQNKQSLFFIDPFGSAIENILQALAKHSPHLLDKVALIDFGDRKNPIAFNPLVVKDYGEIETAVAAVKEMVMKMWNLNTDSAPRAVTYTEQALWAMIECNLKAFSAFPQLALNLLQMADFFTNREFRQLVVKSCTNQAVQATFGEEGNFEKLGERQQLDHVLPILRTFSALSVKNSFANIFGQSENNINISEFVKQGRIVLIKLPAFGVDSATHNFIGSMMIPLVLNALSTNNSKEKRTSYLIFDEFQNYSTDLFADLLADSRKFGLYSIVANQFLEQLSPKVMQGVMINTQTKFVGRLDPKSSAEVMRFVAGNNRDIVPEQAAALNNNEYWGNYLKEDMSSSGPFKFNNLIPLGKDLNQDSLGTDTRERLQSEFSNKEADVMAFRKTHLQKVMRHLENQ